MTCKPCPRILQVFPHVSVCSRSVAACSQPVAACSQPVAVCSQPVAVLLPSVAAVMTIFRGYRHIGPNTPLISVVSCHIRATC